MGENLKHALVQSFDVLGDRALRKRMGPKLFDDMPQVLEVDYTFVASGNCSPPSPGTDLTVESLGNVVRVLMGVTEVARADYKELRATLAEVGGVSAGEVTETSSYGGGFRVRLSKERQP